MGSAERPSRHEFRRHAPLFATLAPDRIAFGRLPPAGSGPDRPHRPAVALQRLRL